MSNKNYRKPPPAPPGNKRAAVDDPLDAREAFRLKESEKEAVAKAAKAAKMKKSQWLRMVVIQALEKTE